MSMGPNDQYGISGSIKGQLFEGTFGVSDVTFGPVILAAAPWRSVLTLSGLSRPRPTQSLRSTL